jgi:hypothetical protein
LGDTENRQRGLAAARPKGVTTDMIRISIALIIIGAVLASLSLVLGNWLMLVTNLLMVATNALTVCTLQELEQARNLRDLSESLMAGQRAER